MSKEKENVGSYDDNKNVPGPIIIIGTSGVDGNLTEPREIHI